jgi:hypothetical protein
MLFMAFGFRSSHGLVTVILSCRRCSWCGNKWLLVHQLTVLPCLALKPGARNLCFQIIVGTWYLPDPTRLRVKIQTLAPQWSCHVRPIYQKVLHQQGTESWRVGTRHPRLWSRWRSLLHIPRTLRHKRHKSKKKKGRDAQANRRGCLHAYEETSQLSRDKKRFHICDHFGGEYCIGIRISPNGSVHAKHTLCLAEALASPARAGNAVIYFKVRSEFGLPDVAHWSNEIRSSCYP